MTPAGYLASIVLPTLAEFTADPGDRRRAYLACIVAAHIVDYVVRAGAGNKARVRDTVRAQSNIPECLDLVEGISNGTKHAGTGQGQQFRFAPGFENLSPGFKLGAPGSAFDEGGWGHGVGLTVEHGALCYYIDDCVRGLVSAFIRAFPALFPGVDPLSVAPWLKPTYGAPAVS